MRPDGLIAIAPIAQHPSNFSERSEVILVEAFVPKPSVETFDERILYRLAGLDMMQSHARSYAQRSMASCTSRGHCP